MLEKFQEIVYKFEEIERKLSDPEIISNQDVYKDLVKNHSELSAGVTAYKTYQKLETELSESEQMLNDPEMGEMAKEEIVSIKQQMSEINNVLVEFLLPKDVNDTRNAIIEIRCVQVEMKQRYLQQIYIECTQSIVRSLTGVLNYYQKI